MAPIAWERAVHTLARGLERLCKKSTTRPGTKQCTCCLIIILILILLFYFNNANQDNGYCYGDNDTVVNRLRSRGGVGAQRGTFLCI